MRNLNGYEIGGRTLRVDNACTEKSRMEMAALLQGPQIENPYGPVSFPLHLPCSFCSITNFFTAL